MTASMPLAVLLVCIVQYVASDTRLLNSSVSILRGTACAPEYLAEISECTMHCIKKAEGMSLK